MRRFLIWSALAAAIGLVLAISGYWAYDHFYARFQPVVVNRGQADIQRLLDEASWVSAGGGGDPLYVIGYRDSPLTTAYLMEEAPKLRAGGVEVRVVMFARADREGQALSTPAERATLAELWLTRDWSLYERWAATPTANWTAAGVPAADGNLARSAVVEAGRQFQTRIGDLMRDAGVKAGYPLIIWRDREGFMKACACTDRRSWTFIRDDIGAPDAIGADAPLEAQPEVITPPTPVAPLDPSLPYPNLPPIPNGQTAPQTSPGQTPSQTRPTTPAARPMPRPAPTPPAPKGPQPPQAQQQDDSTFF